MAELHPAIATQTINPKIFLYIKFSFLTRKSEIKTDALFANFEFKIVSLFFRIYARCYLFLI